MWWGGIISQHWVTSCHLGTRAQGVPLEGADALGEIAEWELGQPKQTETRKHKQCFSDLFVFRLEILFFFSCNFSHSLGYIYPFITNECIPYLVLCQPSHTCSTTIIESSSYLANTTFPEQVPVFFFLLNVLFTSLLLDIHSLTSCHLQSLCEIWEEVCRMSK